jgi:hypothetical protein
MLATKKKKNLKMEDKKIKKKGKARKGFFLYSNVSDA